MIFYKEYLGHRFEQTYNEFMYKCIKCNLYVEIWSNGEVRINDYQIVSGILNLSCDEMIIKNIIE